MAPISPNVCTLTGLQGHVICTLGDLLRAGSKLRQLVVNFLNEQYWAGMPGGRLEPQ